MSAAIKARPKIRPPRKPEQPKDDIFQDLAKAIGEIQQKNASKLSFEKYYRCCYLLVLHKQGDLLYDGISDLVAKHLHRQAESRIQPSFPAGAAAARGSAGSSSASTSTASSVEGEQFLTSVKEVWDDHVACMSKLKDLLKYMDKVYVTSAIPPRLPTYSLGLSLFLQHIIRSTQLPIQDILIRTLLGQIALDRTGQTINKSAVRSCINILIMLKARGGEDGESIYKTEFEPSFLDESRDFYKAEAETLLANGSAPDYLERVERRLQEEDDRLQLYLHHGTEVPLVSLLEHTLITAHLNSVIAHTSGGLSVLVEQDRVSDLKRCYILFGRVGSGLGTLRRALKEWIVSRGLAIAESSALALKASANQNEEEAQPEEDVKGKGKAKAVDAAAPGVSIAITWVQAVLELKDKMDALLAKAFDGDLLFQTAITEAFESFINQNPKAAEYISLFLDDNLRKGLKGKTEGEVDVVIDKAITVFRFISDKDIFETFYRRHLARRLIFQRSVSDDAERGVLAKLKVECGASFVRDLEGMIKDVKLSTDLMVDYKKHLSQSNAQLAIELAVQVCTSSHWPIQQPGAKSDVAIFPEAFNKSIKSFESFYMSRYSGRKLAWRSDLGSVDVKVHFKARKHELNVSTQCMLVLALFEGLGGDESLGYNDIATATAISENELKRTLQSLACGKYRILVKAPKSRDVNTTDNFTFNLNFTSPLARIKIQQIANRIETTDEGKDTRSKIEEERKLLAQACIVRIMKDRKSMQHVDLVNEVAKQLAVRFQPKPSMIKQQIEIMLERPTYSAKKLTDMLNILSQEYLERNSDNRKILQYLA